MPLLEVSLETNPLDLPSCSGSNALALTNNGLGLFFNGQAIGFSQLCGVEIVLLKEVPTRVLGGSIVALVENLVENSMGEGAIWGGGIEETVLSKRILPSISYWVRR
jgi:hypothetical protein